LQHWIEEHRILRFATETARQVVKCISINLEAVFMVYDE
jgi:hypothetical protein